MALDLQPYIGATPRSSLVLSDSQILEHKILAKSLGIPNDVVHVLVNPETQLLAFYPDLAPITQYTRIPRQLHSSINKVGEIVQLYSVGEGDSI